MVSPKKISLAAAFLVVTIASATGCSTTTAPFHMYSSPLLEGEASSHPTAPGGEEGTAGVQARQVYTFQRWGTDTVQGTPSRQIRQPSERRGPRRDIVDVPDRPVLAQASTTGTGAGRAVADAGTSSPRPPIEAPRVDVDDSQRASTAAAYAHAVLSVNDVELPDEARESIPELYRQCRAAGGLYHSNQPNVGDLVFFHNTYDANQDGRNNDWYTLVGIIEGGNSRGGVDFLAFHEGRVQRLQINLDAVGDRASNSRLRQESAEDPPFTQYLSGQLFAGYCDILGDRSDLVVIDNWTPDMDLTDEP